MNAPQGPHPTDPMLRAFGSGRLEASAAASVRAHLEACAECRRRIAGLSGDGSPGRSRGPRAGPETPRPSVSFGDGLSLLEAVPVAGPPPPPLADTLPPGLADHRDYEVIRELGRGGMGVVYLARNTLMGRLEVLKVVGGHLVSRPAVVERFQREIRSAARLHHPNIVTAYAATRLGEGFLLAMEYVDGSDLSRVVKETGPLRVAHACYFVYQAALGLQHAHEHSMVHRDIKPANLILARAGKKAVVKVLDFGLSKVSSEGQADSALTREGQMLGTPDYIAPEQIRDSQSADIRADIYSLGCTLYYLLTGRPPFGGDAVWDVYQAHLSAEAPPLCRVRPDVPVGLAAVVARMMAKEPERRFQEPREVAQALKPFFTTGDVSSSSWKAIDPAAKADLAPSVPVVERPTLIEIPPALPAIAAPPGESRRSGDRTGSHASVIAAMAGALLVSLSAAIWGWIGSGRDDPGALLASRVVETGPPPVAAPAPQPKADRAEPRPADDDPERLIPDALTAVRAGNWNQAKYLLNRYLARPEPRRQDEAARLLVREINLATSSTRADALARRLSQQEIDVYLATAAQPIVDRDVRTPDLRPVYADTLLRSFRKESDRRQSAPNVDASLARAPEPKPPRASATAPENAAEEARLPTKLVGRDDDTAPVPARPVVGDGATTLDMIVESPRSYEGRTITLDGHFKLGTMFARIRASDGHSIGWSIPVGRADDRLICKGDGKVMGRNVYLVLGEDLGPALLKAFNEFKFHPASRPTHKGALTVTVHHLVDDSVRVPVVEVVGLEILGTCNFLEVARRQYDRAFWVLRVTHVSTEVTYGDGPAWVERLGGEEKFIRPLRRKLNDLEKRAMTDRTNAVVGNVLQDALGRSVNMAIASQQQQARFAAAFFGR